MNKTLLTTMALALSFAGTATAQMAKNVKGKFLGNITTSYNWAEYCDPQECSNSYVYSDYWNQVTCENATKWGSVHSGWGKFNWSNADRTYNYCKQKGIIFKFHALIWGSQYPGWIKNLSVADTKKAIIEWFDEVKKHYPDLQIIDVVNEAIYAGGNYHSPYKETKIIEALGSLAEDRLGKKFNCTTNGYPNADSYQWLAEAFRLARERWPNAVLIYNDYNTFQWQRNEFIALVNGIKACGAPIDAAGNQAHDLNDMSGNNFKNALEEIHNKTKLPQYITEYDICKNDDNTQLTRYKEQFPIMWEADYVAGVTLWGWVFGKTWVSDNGVGGASGIIRNCSKRPAFTWLESYMKTSAAQNVKSPITVGGSSTAPSVSAKLSLSQTAISVGETVTISCTADVKNDELTHFDIYADNDLLVNKYVAPYEWTFTPEKVGTYTIKIIAYGKSGETDQKTAVLTVCEERAPYSGKAIAIPGTIEAEDFDLGCAGISYFDSDTANQGGEYRKTAVDIVTGNNGYAIGYTAQGEWTEYTVNVKCAGEYDVIATVASGSDNSAVTVEAMSNGQSYASTDDLRVPNGGDWDTYTTVEGRIHLEEGEQIVRFFIGGSYVNIDKVTFENKECTTGFEVVNNDNIVVYPNPATNHISVKGAPENVSLKLYDTTSRLVASSESSEIDIPESFEGVYFLKIFGQNNVVVRKVVIK